LWLMREHLQPTSFLFCFYFPFLSGEIHPSIPSIGFIPQFRCFCLISLPDFSLNLPVNFHLFHAKSITSQLFSGYYSKFSDFLIGAFNWLTDRPTDLPKYCWNIEYTHPRYGWRCKE
jgi:hypothetical protein